MITILATASISGMLIAFLYALLAIVMIGGLIWLINKYIHQIPEPVLMIVAIVMVILLVIWMVGETPAFLPRQ